MVRKTTSRRNDHPRFIAVWQLHEKVSSGMISGDMYHSPIDRSLLVLLSPYKCSARAAVARLLLFAQIHALVELSCRRLPQDPRVCGPTTGAKLKLRRAETLQASSHLSVQCASTRRTMRRCSRSHRPGAISLGACTRHWAGAACTHRRLVTQRIE